MKFNQMTRLICNYINDIIAEAFVSNILNLGPKIQNRSLHVKQEAVIR